MALQERRTAIHPGNILEFIAAQPKDDAALECFASLDLLRRDMLGKTYMPSRAMTVSQHLGARLWVLQQQSVAYPEQDHAIRVMRRYLKLARARKAKQGLVVQGFGTTLRVSKWGE